MLRLRYHPGPDTKSVIEFSFGRGQPASPSTDGIHESRATQEARIDSVAASKESLSTQDVENSRPSVPAPAFRLTLIGIGFLSLVAFRSVLGAPFEWSGFWNLETWFFDPSRDSRAIAIVVSAWLLISRRKEIAASGSPRVGGVHLVAAALVVLAFGWATWWRAPLLLMLAFFAYCMIVGTAWGGSSANRYFHLPCLALLFSMTPPNPLFSELVWWLQRVSAHGAHALLSLGGMGIEIEGTELRLGGHSFAVIEACSGWRGMSILLIVSVVAAALNSLSIRRTLVLAAIALPLGLALNIARVAAVVATQQEMSAELFESHTPQGIAVLLVGTLVLYIVAAWLGSLRPHLRAATGADSQSEDDATPAPAVGPPTDPRRRSRFGHFLLGLAFTLALASLLLPSLSGMPDASSTHRVAPSFPMMHASWFGTVLEPNYYFPYNSGDHPQFHAEYQRKRPRQGLEVVDLFVTLESPQISGLNRLPESKLILPAADWGIDAHEIKRLSMLGTDVQTAILSRGVEKEFALVMAWRVNDQGLWRESFASLLGMDACDFGRRRCARGVVRVAVPMVRATRGGRDRAMETAMQFMRDFRAPLMHLVE